MALTAIAPSGLTRDLSWDESIVPALRKRLESESHALSKRMSAASMGSNDDPPQDGLSSNASYVMRDRATVVPQTSIAKPSAIPRPSLQQSRPSEMSVGVNGRSSRSGSFQRSRTLSQPFPIERPTPTPFPPQQDSTSRSASPMVAVRSTRIPVSRTRTGSMSSSKQQSSNGSVITVRVESRNGSNKASGPPYQSYAEPMPELWPVNEAHQLSAAASRSTIRTLTSQASDLVNQQAPFNANTSMSSYDQDFPRLSSESEERPFEHWYRGDVSRNGGVGELRVGKRQEMLDIANYGHPLRESSSKTALSHSRSRSNSRGREHQPTESTHRSRAGSVGARESIYMDDDRVQLASMMFDERPPTDLESDDDEYGEEEADYEDEDAQDQTPTFARDTGTVSPPLSLDRSDTPTTLVDNSRPSGFKSRIPTPTPRQIAGSSRTVTPTQSPTLSTTDPSVSKGKPPTQPAAQKLNASANSSQGSKNNKRRAKSPGAAASKKTRTKPPAKPQPNKKLEARQSVAYYPTPEGDDNDMIHAIPSWTQPVPPPSGNWDDAVLPVVARKKGLEGQYQQANGGPRPSKPLVTIPEPAPGTFGFRYRGKEETPVGSAVTDEFGQQDSAYQEVEMPQPLEPPEPEKLAAPTSPLSQGRRSPGSPRAQSPAPFSQYPAPTPVPQIRVTRPSSEVQKMDLHVDEEPEGGCCKCIIM